MALSATSTYDSNVFINCPFDKEYSEKFRAIVFAVMECGFTPRCALEESNSGQVRIERINNIIERCRLGIHDISGTELDGAHSLPRFNMPLELGLFLGCKRFGNGNHASKSCLIFDKEQFRYQKFISDIAGQDINSHDDKKDLVIKKLRDWLSSQKDDTATILPGGSQILRRYNAFEAALPKICRRMHLEPSELTFKDLVWVIKKASS